MQPLQLLSRTKAGPVVKRPVSLAIIALLVFGFTVGATSAGTKLAGVAQAADKEPATSKTTAPHAAPAKKPRVSSIQDGTVDTSFKSGAGANGYIYSTVYQTGGKILIGGDFTTYYTATTGTITRLNSDGSADSSFNAGGSGANSTVRAITVQSDGKILIGGDFTTYNGTSVSRLARLNSDGTLDTTFNVGGSGASDTVYTIVEQSDGKLLVGGNFQTYNGVGPHFFTRLNSDGSIDSSFNVGGTATNGTVFSIVAQSSGQILVAGYYDSYNGTSAPRLIRLNSDGSIDSTFNAFGTGANDAILTVSVQPDGQLLISGNFSSYNGTNAGHIARLNTDGSLDTSFNSTTGANNFVYTHLLQSDGKILIGGKFTTYNGTTVNYVTRLNTDGSLDPNFNAGGSGASDRVYSIALQSDNKIIVSGYLLTYDSTVLRYIGRLNTDGTVDSSFIKGSLGANAAVSAIRVQNDGKILIGGYFTSYNGATAGYITRLNSDGSLDTSFNVGGSGANALLQTIALQTDGKIVIGGNFSTYNGTATGHIARLNSDGSLDTSFNPSGSGTDNTVNSLAVQTDGKIVIGGNFQTYNGVTAKYITRLNSDGSLDTNFNLGGSGATGAIYSLVVQSNGKIVIGGYFGSYNTTGSPYIVRLNSDGSLDSSFSMAGTSANDGVFAVAVQSDSKILIGGYFTSYNTITATRVARLNVDGSLDTSFNSGAGFESTVKAFALQGDGKILVGGSFSTYNNVVVGHIVRLNSDGSLDTSFNTGTGVSRSVSAIALQSDGKILLGGFFTSVNSYITEYIARLYNRAFSTVALTSSPTPAAVGSSVTFTATIQPASATGSVVFAFTTGANTISATTTVANGAASYMTSTLPVGTTQVTAYYSGDNAVLPASSAIYTQTITCDPLMVNSNLDNGSCGTLRQALVAASSSQTKTVKISLPAGSVISLTTGLTLTSGVSITTTAQCGSGANNTMVPPITLQGVGASSGNGLTLAGSNQLYGLWVRGFSGVQIKAPAGSSTKMQCVKASKL